MMHPVVYRRGSNVSINFRNWAHRLLWSEGFNADQWGAVDDLMLGICGDCFNTCTWYDFVSRQPLK